MLYELLIIAQLTAGQPVATDLPHCALSLYAVTSSGARSATPFLSPKHVTSIADAGIDVSGEHLWRVSLTAAGAAINRRYSKGHVGQKIAVMCGTREIVRPTIQGASAEEFMFTTPVVGPNNSFKPKPLRGSA